MLSVELLFYLTIPLVSALVGWGTNKVAIQMMFYPIEPIGKPPFFGWQGVIPSKAEKMATKTVEVMTERILKARDVFDRLDARAVTAELEPVLATMFEQIIEDVMSQQAPTRWKLLPRRIKREIFERAAEDAPQAIHAMMEELADNIEELLDLKKLSIDALSEDKRLLIEIFQRCGREEFKFIERSGLVFGFAFGLVQMVAWFFFPEWWVLPLFGLLVGYATNWLALKMIFEPLMPTPIGPWTWQGLFLKRQPEVAAEYAKIVTAHVLNPQGMIRAIMEGPASDKFYEIVQRHLQDAIDANAGWSEPFVKLALGTETYERIKHTVADRVLERLPASMQMLEHYTAEAMGIEDTLREKMRALTPAEFELLLRGAFQEDEILLILVGAALGVAVGFAQLAAW